MLSETLPEVAGGSNLQVNSNSPHDINLVESDGADLESGDEEPSTSVSTPRRGH